MRFCLYMIAVTVLLVPPGRSAGLVQGARIVPVVKSDPRSGQLVTTIVLTGKVAGAIQPTASRSGRTPSAEVKTLVDLAAKDYDVAPELVHSVIQVESNYDQFAVSPKGAQGLMQLMPATAKRFGVTDTFDPKQNIEAGVRYLKFLQKTFKDDRLAIAAYNAGEGAVQRYGSVPPYPETVDYVAKVGKRIGQAQQAETAKRVAEKKEAAVEAPEYRRLATTVGADGRVYLSTQ